MSASDEAGPRKKHRHDLGHEDHGAVMLEGRTKTIQVLLGIMIAATIALVIYTAAGGNAPASPSAPPGATPAAASGRASGAGH